MLISLSGSGTGQRSLVVQSVVRALSESVPAPLACRLSGNRVAHNGACADDSNAIQALRIVNGGIGLLPALREVDR